MKTTVISFDILTNKQKTGEGGCMEMFYKENLLSQRVDDPTHISAVEGQALSTLYRFLTS